MTASTGHWTLLLATLLAAACGNSSPSTTSSALTIAVIPKGTTHEFWKSIHAGAVQAAQELSAAGTAVEVIWKGPLREDDREQQIQVVESFLSQGVDGIVLAPLDNRALVRPVEEAKRAGLPTVIIDSGLESSDMISFVATDNRQGGRLAADRLAQLVGPEGTVLLLRYQEGSASTHEREEGFLEQLRAKHPRIRVISSEQYAGPTRETAKRTSENLLNRFGKEIHGIFTVNESSTVGMLLALQDIRQVGRLQFVGFDASQILVDALRAGELHGLIVQNPMRMGYLGVKTMVDHLQGRTVAKTIDTGVMLVTAENMEAPEVRPVLHPPVEQYLGNR